MPRGITLADGPHMLEAPKVSHLIELQRLGYPLAGLFGNALNKRTGLIDEDGDAVVEPDLGAIADHLAVLLRTAEPHEGWDAVKVADSMTIEGIGELYKTLWELGFEGSGEGAPKAP